MEDFWDELTPEQQANINQGIKDIEEGRVKEYEEAMSKHRK